MIKEIILDNQIIKYQITFKNNKNTYFRFKREGYIQINASRYQTHRQIFKYMRDNKKTFIEKYQKIASSNLKDFTKLALEECKIFFKTPPGKKIKIIH